MTREGEEEEEELISSSSVSIATSPLSSSLSTTITSVSNLSLSCSLSNSHSITTSSQLQAEPDTQQTKTNIYSSLSTSPSFTTSGTLSLKSGLTGLPLPFHLILKCFRFCHLWEICKCLGVCRAWNRAIQEWLKVDRKYLRACARHGYVSVSMSLYLLVCVYMCVFMLNLYILIMKRHYLFVEQHPV